MSDLNWQEISPVQNEAGKGVRTIASAATISPTTGLTVVTGTTQLVTIVPPVSGFHVLYLQFTGAMGVFSTAGNILVAADPGVDIPVAMYYNPLSGKYIPGPIS
jgi:hypothetical protein